MRVNALTYSIWFLLLTCLAGEGPFDIITPGAEKKKWNTEMESQEESVALMSGCEGDCGVCFSFGCAVHVHDTGYVFQGDIPAVDFYSYGNPFPGSSYTGLEKADCLVFFYYEDTITEIVSLIFIADIAGDGSGGEMTLSFSDLPASASVALSDDPGEFIGVPPLIVSTFTWDPGETDGGIIENIGCNFEFHAAMYNDSGVDGVIFQTPVGSFPIDFFFGFNWTLYCNSCIRPVVEPDVTNATCPETADGSIDLTVSSGAPPYSFQWSNGSLSEDIEDLLPGLYEVTITDSEGCSETLEVEVESMSEEPLAVPAEITLCSDEGIVVFDLTIANDIINLGMGYTVLWYEDANLNNFISTPESYLSGSGVVYAVVDNGVCLSDSVPVTLEVLISPVGNPATLNMCEEETGQATFDLTALNDAVSGGAGNVWWYLDMDLLNVITDPGALMTGSTTVYATVDDGECTSEPVEITLIVDPKPVANPAELHACGNELEQGVFDLTGLNDDVGGGVFLVEWYENIELTDTITNPASYLSSSGTIYAVVFDGECYSDAAAVVLIVHPQPEGFPTSIETCPDSNGNGVFDLTAVNEFVSGGLGGVTWYEDALGQVVILDSVAYMSGGSTVYAQFEVDSCPSMFIPVELILVNNVMANSTEYDVCGNGNGMGVFDLGSIEGEVGNFSGILQWYWDSLGLQDLTGSDSLVIGDTIIYAAVVAGVCTSEVVSVTLGVLNLPVAMDTSLQICGDSGIATIDLTSVEGHISGGSGDVAWYGDMALSSSIQEPAGFTTQDTVVYATVSNAICESLPADINISVSAGVQSNPIDTAFCLPPGEDTLSIDLTAYDLEISSGTGNVSWFLDSVGTMSIDTPTAFIGTQDFNVFAQVSDGVCVSTAPVVIALQPTPEIQPISIQRCGDSLDVSLDLTLFEEKLGAGLDSVSWYADSSATILISDPGNFVSTDTSVYAVAMNVSCRSAVVPVVITLVDELSVNSLHIDTCVVGSNSVVIDLTEYTVDILGSAGNLVWYHDELGTDTLVNPDAADLANGDTVYAQAFVDTCASELASVSISVININYPDPLCAFTSTDSISISWDSVSLDYEITYAINGVLTGTPELIQSNEFSLGGLAEADTVSVYVSAVYDDPCMSLADTVTCITEVCPSQTVEFVGLDPEYCSDVPFIVVVVSPPGGELTGAGISGDTLYPGLVGAGSIQIDYLWTDSLTGCRYSQSATILIADPLDVPQVICNSTSMNTIEFSWTALGNIYGYSYQVNQGAVEVSETTDEAILVEGLNEGDEVTLSLWSVGTLPCGNSDSVMVTCKTKECSIGTVSITDPGVICSEDMPFALQYDTSGIPPTAQVHWSGAGVDSLGLFDPGGLQSGKSTVILMLEDAGCTYADTLMLSLIEQPVADFIISGVPCVDSSLQITFTGLASQAAVFDWQLDGADVIAGELPFDFAIQWHEPSQYTLSLTVNDGGCITASQPTPIDVYTALDEPIIYCLEEQFNSVVVGWDPVDGATDYTVSSSIGIGAQNGNTYTVSNLPDNTQVEISVIAIGMTECGPATASVTCHTLERIPVKTYIPNVFSPNSDQINDVLFVQANDQVARIAAFRVFDRWGELVYQLLDFLPNDPALGWDGTFNGEPVQPGVYVYYYQIMSRSGEAKCYTGDVTLIR